MLRVIEPLVFDNEAAQLLIRHRLPTADLPDSLTTLLFGLRHNGVLVGLVGLDFCDSSSLVRSLVVSGNYRGQGLGAELLAFAEQYALKQRVRDMYLLTTSASRFFARHGYSYALRADAPPAIAATAQFSSLCPSSASFMVKHLYSAPSGAES